MTKAGPVANSWVISNVSNPSGNTVRITTTAANGVTVGNKVTVWGVTGSISGFANNGEGSNPKTWTVTAADNSGPYYFEFSYGSSVTGSYTSGGYLVNLYTPTTTDVIDLSGAIVSEDAITVTSVAYGKVTASNLTLSTVSGATCQAIMLYDINNERMIVHLDTASGLPVIPNGGDIIVSFDGSLGVFSL